MGSLIDMAFSDPSLSWKSKGIYYYLRRLSDNQIEIENALSDLLKNAKDKIGAVRAGIKELESRGYLTQEQAQDAQGVICWRYVLVANPQIIQGQSPIAKTQLKPDPLLEFWNSLPNVRRHRITSIPYKKAVSLFQQLKRGNFLQRNRINRAFSERHSIRLDLFTNGRYFNDERIRGILSNMSKFFTNGYGYEYGKWYLTNEGWKSTQDLNDLIFNPRTGSSLFAVCATHGIPKNLSDCYRGQEIPKKYVELIRPHLHPILDQQGENNLLYSIDGIMKAQMALGEYNNWGHAHLLGDPRGTLIFIRTYVEFLDSEYGSFKLHKVGPGTRNWQRFMEYLKGEGVKLPDGLNKTCGNRT